jgi:hypothetical protein
MKLDELIELLQTYRDSEDIDVYCPTSHYISRPGSYETNIEAELFPSKVVENKHYLLIKGVYKEDYDK